MINSFNTRDTLTCQNTDYEFFNLEKLNQSHSIRRLPYALKILLENLLRCEDGMSVLKEDIQALINWDPKATPNHEIAFMPARVILQDFTGVPAIVDLAAMREAIPKIKGSPSKINPLSPVELVIDHSVMVDFFGDKSSFEKNTAIEITRNQERYRFLRWGQNAFRNFKVVPPGTGIVHQVNLEYLARVVFTQEKDGKKQLFPDTLVGTDSHTTMINGLGILGWGVGGIEAEAAMLGQPITMLIPQVIGFEIKGHLNESVTATDLVLTITQILRQKGVVGKFVEFFGQGLNYLSVADRATIANMAPEYGATVGIFPIDQATLDYLAFTGRTVDECELIKLYAQKQGLFHEENQIQATYTDVLHLDLKDVHPSIAGPKRPQDKIALKDVKTTYQGILGSLLKEKTNLDEERNLNEGANIVEKEAARFIDTFDELTHGSVVIAAITSCTNTSNPDVMVAAGLIAKKALEKGLKPKHWVKTSLAPGSQVVMDYLQQANLVEPLDKLGFNLVGFGCTTCIGNSGPLPEKVSHAIRNGNLTVAAVLSGNRNFEGRIHPEVQHAFLASPPLVVIYALAGTMNIDLTLDPIGYDQQGQLIYMKDLWPSKEEIEKVIQHSIQPQLFINRYKSVFEGNQMWQALDVGSNELFDWDESSTYVKNPPYFENMTPNPLPFKNIEKARVLLKLSDSVTTDHISPAGAIDPKTPAGIYLLQQGVTIEEFNSYGSRRGNHEVMIRGTFANRRLRNELATPQEGGWTRFQPSNELMTVYDASVKYQANHTPLIVLAGKEYGTGSSRDWAAKGTILLGIRAVIAESFERIHRSNLIGMGVLPLQFKENENAASLGLKGHETYSISLESLEVQGKLRVVAIDENNQSKEFEVNVCIDTPKEFQYYQHGGILPYVLRQLSQSEHGVN